MATLPSTVPVTYFGGPFDGHTLPRAPSNRYAIWFTCSDACNPLAPWHDHPFVAHYRPIAWVENDEGVPLSICALIEAVEEWS